MEQPKRRALNYNEKRPQNYSLRSFLDKFIFIFCKCNLPDDILIQEELFHSLMGQLLNQSADAKYEFSEKDYWMNGKEACKFLNISQAALNAFRNNRMLFHCKIKELYQYKRSDVYKMKTEMDKELVESGMKLGDCKIINTEEEAIKVYENK